MVNVHFSLLPRWRGAAPVERAILAGDTTTGVCLMDVEEGLDTGGVYRRAAVAIGAEETAAELRARLGDIGTALLIEALAEGLGAPEPQAGEVTYADKITGEDRHIDWMGEAQQQDRVVRIGDAWTTFRGLRLKVLRARPTQGGNEPGSIELRHGELVVSCGSGALTVIEVQAEGKPPVAGAAWARGARLTAGDRLGP
jgi:methionyl-tRNA formyltransferase